MKTLQFILYCFVLLYFYNAHDDLPIAHHLWFEESFAPELCNLSSFPQGNMPMRSHHSFVSREHSIPDVQANILLCPFLENSQGKENLSDVSIL